MSHQMSVTQECQIDNTDNVAWLIITVWRRYNRLKTRVSPSVLLALGKSVCTIKLLQRKPLVLNSSCQVITSLTCTVGANWLTYQLITILKEAMTK